MASEPNTQISILGSSFLQPTADLISKLCETQKSRVRSANSSSFEHGYSASIVLLLVAMFESYVVRVRHIHGRSIVKMGKHAIQVMEYCYPRFRNRIALKEVYILRDIIFHNHLWEINFVWNKGQGSRLTRASKVSSYKDGKYDDRVDITRRRTKALRLSIVPTLICRTDVRKVFQTVWKILIFLESKNRNQCCVSSLRVRYKGKTVLFSELIRHL